MGQSAILKWLVGIALTAVALLAGAWLWWVPSAREPGYAFVAAWGEPGNGPGQFHDPTGIAVAGDEAFVSDARNGRIQVFGHDGVFRREFGKLGRPMNLSIFGDTLYVADYWTDRVEVFGLDGTHRVTIGRSGAGPGEFDAPGGVAIGKDGDLFVVDFYNQRVQHLDADGGFVGQVGETRRTGIAAGSFNYPTDVAVGPDGTLYVADGYNDRIQAFDADGRFLHKWGGPLAVNIHGPFNGWFATVTGIVVDAQGNVFAADFYNDRVQKFASDGTFLTAFGTAGPIVMTGPRGSGAWVDTSRCLHFGSRGNSTDRLMLIVQFTKHLADFRAELPPVYRNPFTIVAGLCF